ncbi:aldo/keto reductase [Allomuricauda sp. SCSIO 65647]|uniref:aldo/keto reductase n=1 Tax=Allomuricauda sp. SCSIO 65647 TaxID=2908843 RepID=UPI001F416C3A|nr:aldo/keto reductase [Muricauda sp. SCSIO 65647]UJH69001.1 aldo/keto reductase [Muricauda sp. SCSIO 65647]
MNNITDLQGTFTLHNGIKMPYFGLGVYLSKDGQEVIDAVKWALEAGYRHIDTASIYRNEQGVGQGIRESSVNREEVFLVSKVWNADQGYESTLKAFDDSLKRLETDYLDLYLVHWPVAGKYKDTWKALEKLYRDGRIKAIGVSNFLQHHLEDLLQAAEIVPMVNQMEFHPYLVQQALIDFCRKNAIQYEAWSPLMQGHIFDMEEFKGLAGKYNKSIAQIALRWDLQKGVVTIPKSSKKERIIANADIFDFELSEEDVQLVNRMDKGKRFGPDPDNFDF